MPLFNRSLFQFDGRVGRRSYATAVVMLTLAGVLLAPIPLVGDIATLLVLWPAACVTAKRLHDCGRSARPAVVVTMLCTAVGIATILVDLQVAGNGPNLVVLAVSNVVALAGILTGLVSLALVIWVGAIRGDAATNAFGPPPGIMKGQGIHQIASSDAILLASDR